MTSRWSLAAEIEAAEADGNRRYTDHQCQSRPDYSGDYLDLDGPGALFCFPGSDMNYVAGLGFDSRDDIAVVFDRIEAFYRARRSAWTLEISSLANPAVVETAAQRGYRPGPVAHLWGKRLGNVKRPTTPSSIRIAEVAADQADNWAHTAARGFGKGTADRATEQILRGFAGVPGTRLYVARDPDGMAVGSAAMAFGPNHAKLFSGSTLPAFRGRGIQTALLYHRLEEAQALGFGWAIVQTDPNTSSERNAVRVGFDLLYCKLTLKSPPLLPFKEVPHDSTNLDCD